MIFTTGQMNVTIEMIPDAIGKEKARSDELPSEEKDRRIT